jgi:hypothetical protein
MNPLKNKHQQDHPRQTRATQHHSENERYEHLPLNSKTMTDKKDVSSLRPNQQITRNPERNDFNNTRTFDHKICTKPRLNQLRSIHSHPFE